MSDLLAVRCATCGAVPGEPCRDQRANPALHDAPLPLRQAHPARKRPPRPTDRCVHHRCRIDPCIGCGRRYKQGKISGPFITT